MFSEKRFLIIGAHPDDADLMFGGCAVKLSRNGHKVKFVSITNGDAGHYSETREKLAKRRFKEAIKSAEVAGIEGYENFNNHDGELMPSIENRRQITTLIREFRPDVIVSHRTCDYHADHRATAQLVQDSAYLVMVPMFCPHIPIPKNNPIYLFSYDSFKKPYPFHSDVAVNIDDVILDKLQMINCHVSQFYEWLPYTEGRLEEVPDTWEGRQQWLIDGWLERNIDQAVLAGGINQTMKYAETFELSEYGRQPDNGELDQIFGF